MAIQAKKQNPWFFLLILLVAGVLWILDHKKAVVLPQSDPQTTEVTRSPAQQGRYEVYQNCTLAPDRGNDGDSFRVNLPDGRREIFRLYFVDTPESAFKSYSGGQNNHQRIADQAAYFGITPDQAVEVGKQAKSHILDLLSRQPFTLHTEWDSPFKDERYHAFIEVKSNGKPRLLHELLIEKGLARLKTKPAELPDGTPASKHRQTLEALQRQAKQSATGAWK